jgi:mRNA interferase MazF
MRLLRGDVLLMDYEPIKGAEINKIRPAVIISNNVANLYSSLVTVVPLTSQKLDKVRHNEALLEKHQFLKKPSKVKVDQIRTMDKTRVLKKLGSLSENEMEKVDIALKLHLDLDGL